MANKYFDTEFVDKALIFAINAHHNTERRGKKLPYIIHPMEVVSIIAVGVRENDPQKPKRKTPADITKFF